LKVIANERKK